MNAFALAPVDITVSSLDVAEITNKRHFHILRDIREMASALKIDVTKFGFIFSDAYGRPLHGFKLPQREFLILASGYSVKLRAKLVDRWIELEQAARRQAPDYVTRAEFEALRAEVVANRAPKIASTLPDRMRNFIRERGAVKKHVLLKRFPDINASQRDGVLNRLCVEGHVQIILVSPPRSGRPASVCRWVQ